MSHTTRVSRRAFLGLAGCSAGALALVGCTVGRRAVATDASNTASASMAAATATPTPVPDPTFAQGVEPVRLLPGTPWETAGVAIHSGVPGPRMMILGGVHGNEPGGWLAAEAIAEWRPARGSLVVLPRMNRVATLNLVRTTTELGDLNRLYPGDANGLPMARMAAAVIEVGRTYYPHLLFDLHESWVFYNERGANGGTAFIGQTLAHGGTEETGRLLADVVNTVNARITKREEFILRSVGGTRGTGTPTATPTSTATPSGGATPIGAGVGGGTTSLALGRWIPGCAPVLIEMGQQDQAEARRAQLHQMLVATAMERAGMT